MSTEQDDRVSRLKDNKAKIESEHNLMQQRILDFQNESKKISQQFNTDFTKIKKGILEEINSVMKNVDGLNQELKAYKDKTLVSDKDALNSRLENLLGQITSNVESLQKRIVDLSTVQEEEVSTIYSDMAKKVNVGLNDIYSRQRSKISDFESDISNWLGTIQREMRALVERESTNLNEMTETIASSFSGTLNVATSIANDESTTERDITGLGGSDYFIPKDMISTTTTFPINNATSPEQNLAFCIPLSLTQYKIYNISVFLIAPSFAPMRCCNLSIIIN